MGLRDRFWDWAAGRLRRQEQRERHAQEQKAAPSVGDLFTASRLPGEIGRPLWSGSKAGLVKRYTEYTYAFTARISDAVAQVPLRLYYMRNAERPPAGEERYAPKPARVHVARFMAGQSHLQKYIAPQGELMEVTQHPLLTLFADANPEMDGYFLSKLTVVFLALTGEGYTWMQPDKALDVPMALWPLPSQWTRPVPGKHGLIDHYEYGRTQSEVTKYPADQVIFHREVNPSDILAGYARLAAVAGADQLYEEMNEYERYLFANRCEPGGLWKTDQRLTPKQRKELRTEIESLHRGRKRTGRTGIADKGLDFKPTQLPPKDMAYTQGRKATVNEMAAGFGVPLALVRTEDVNKANAEVGERQFARYCIRPITRLLEQKWNQILVPRYDRRLFLVHDDPVQEDREALREDRKVYFGLGVWSPDDIREQLGEARKGGALGMHYIVGLATPLAEEGEEPPPKPEPEPEPEPEDDEEPEGPDQEGKAARVPKPLPKGLRVREQGLSRIRARFRVTAMRLWREQRAEVVARIRASAKAIDPGDVEEWLGEPTEWARKWEAETRQFIRAAVLKGGEATMTKLFAMLPEPPAAMLAFNIDNPGIREWLEREPFEFAKEVSEATANRLRATLRAGTDAAETHRQLVKRVNAIFNDPYRAETIVSTETSWAHDQAGLEAAKQSGVVRAKVWRTLPTACEYCQPYEGKVVGLDETFIAIGQETLPGAKNGRTYTMAYRDVDIAQRHPRCQCYISYELLEEFQA